MSSKKYKRDNQTALLDDDSQAVLPVGSTTTPSSSRRSAAKPRKEAPPPEVEEEEDDQPKGFFSSRTNIIGAVVSVLVILAIIGGVAWFLLSSSDSGNSPPNVTYWDTVLLSNVNSTELNANFYKVTTGGTSLAGTVTSTYTVDAVRAAFTAAFAGFENITSVITVMYAPLLSYPAHYNPDSPSTTAALGDRTLTILNNSTRETVWTARLIEDVIASDPSTSNNDAVPTFNGYSPSTPPNGITAELVYVNYGRVEDFQFLDAHGAKLVGRIAIARYGGNFRGLKVALAQQYNMSAVLIYSDPADDGFTLGGVYPDGPYRPPSSVQRGSASFMSVFEGDPLTPYVPANGTFPAKFTVDTSPSLPKIPVQPISYQDAYQLLANLTGTPVNIEGNFTFPPDWQGGFGKSSDAFPAFTQRIGQVLVNDTTAEAFPLHVHLFLNMTYVNRNVTDVIATITGSEEPDKWVMVGNHRDSWVYGGVDPHEGTAAIMELARVLGVMVKQGWRPKRTLKLCSWDAEEQALIGSTEWVEDMILSQNLQEKAIAYINVDVAVTGGFAGATYAPVLMVRASPSLGAVVTALSHNVLDPWKTTASTNVSLYDSWNGGNGAVVGELGSGSDYTAFLDYAGIASVHLELGNQSMYGVYHSVYDSYTYTNKFADADGKGKFAMTQFWGLVALNLSDAVVLPFSFVEYGQRLDEHLVYVQNLSQSTSVLPDFTALETAVTQFKSAAASLRDALASYDPAKQAATTTQALNAALAQTEQQFLVRNHSFPGRHNMTWYRHVVYAPGLWAGYAPTFFPAVNDAIVGPVGPGIGPGDNKSQRQADAQTQIAATAGAVTQAAGWLVNTTTIATTKPPPMSSSAPPAASSSAAGTGGTNATSSAAVSSVSAVSSSAAAVSSSSAAAVSSSSASPQSSSSHPNSSSAASSSPAVVSSSSSAPVSSSSSAAVHSSSTAPSSSSSPSHHSSSSSSSESSSSGPSTSSSSNSSRRSY